MVMVIPLLLLAKALNIAVKQVDELSHSKLLLESVNELSHSMKFQIYYGQNLHSISYD